MFWCVVNLQSRSQSSRHRRIESSVQTADAVSVQIVHRVPFMPPDSATLVTVQNLMDYHIRSPVHDVVRRVFVCQDAHKINTPCNGRRSK